MKKTLQQKNNCKPVEIDPDVWKFALKGNKDGVWDWNAQTSEVFFSTEWKTMLGFTNDEICGDYGEWEKRIHPDDKQTVLDTLTAYLSGKTDIFQVEHRLFCKDNTYKWVLTRGHIFSWTPDGKPLRVIGTHTDISMRKELEASLETSRSQQKAILDNLPFIAWMKDLDGRYIAFNEPFLKATGRTYSQAYGKTDLEVWPPEIGEIYRKNDESVIRSGKRKLVEEQVREAGQPEYWVESWKAPIFNSKNELIGTAGFARDISERKRYEQELARQNAELHAIFNAFPDLFFRLDETGRIVEFHSGKSNGDMHIGDYSNEGNVGDFFEPEIGKLFLDALTVIRSTGEKQSFEYTQLSRGKTAYYEARLVVIQNGDYAALVRDITDRKQMQDALNKSERLYRSIVELANEGIWMLDEDDRTVFVNKTLCDMIGYTAEEMMGKSIFDFSDESGRKVALKNLGKRHSEIPDEQDFQFIRKDGSPLWVMISIASLKDEEQRYKGYLAMIIDMTERRKFIQELEDKNQLLREINDLFHAQAITDSLTGLFNRRHILLSLTEEIDRSRRYASKLTIMMIDVDYFKSINDRFGHQIGDAVLIETCRTIKGHLRSVDKLGRYGGEEFMAILPETDISQAVKVAERIRKSVEAIQFEQQELCITVSIGLAEYNSNSTDTMIGIADKNLYIAKNKGRNRVEYQNQ